MSVVARAGLVFLPRLEGLRGIAALTVALFHAGQSPWNDLDGGRHTFLDAPLAGDHSVVAVATKLLRHLANGPQAVNVFFVLSGFVLAASLMNGPQEILPSARKFFVARLFRLYPAVFATVAFFSVRFWLFGPAEGFAPPVDLEFIVENALLLFVAMNGVMWTLQVEVAAAPVIFFTFIASRRRPALMLAAIFAVITAITIVYSDAYHDWFGKMCPPAGLPVTVFQGFHIFIFGMLLYAAGPRHVAKWPAWVVVTILALATAGLLAPVPDTVLTINSTSFYFLIILFCRHYCRYGRLRKAWPDRTLFRSRSGSLFWPHLVQLLSAASPDIDRDVGYPEFVGRVGAAGNPDAGHRGRAVCALHRGNHAARLADVPIRRTARHMAGPCRSESLAEASRTTTGSHSSAERVERPVYPQGALPSAALVLRSYLCQIMFDVIRIQLRIAPCGRGRC